MAFLIFSTLKGRELAREPLKDSVVIGRSPECDITIHDILLSRRHCQIERHGSSWMLVDLASKNGSFVNDQMIVRCELKDGQTARIGKTVVKFQAGVLQTAAHGGKALDRPNTPRQRPCDPWAAMNDTMSGFDYAKSLAERNKLMIGRRQRYADRAKADGSAAPPLPVPKPVPPEPDSYHSEDIYSLLTELASSSWDSIYMNASRPKPTLSTRRMLHGSSIPGQRPASPMSPPMQIKLPPVKPPPAPPVMPTLTVHKPMISRGMVIQMAKGLATVGQSVILLGMLGKF